MPHPLAPIPRALAAFCALALCALWSAAPVAAQEWPNAPGDDPLEALPNDPNFVRFDDQGRVVGGQWNLWSFTPELWSDNPGFREEEIAMGTGMWVDRAWQRTIGRSDVVIAVLDSGAYWDEPDLISKYYLNRAELNTAAKRPLPPSEDYDGDPFDINDDGVFNVDDYLAVDPEGELARLDGPPGNGNGVLDPQDLIRHFSDGVDDDDNGYIDDISGWDFFWHDNDAYDTTRFGHGNGEAKDSAAETNNNHGDAGVCPKCMALMVRVGDSFVTDSNDFADGVVFAVDSGAQVVQEALGTVNNTAFSRAAIDYAYANNVVTIASAADELSFHHNMPGTNNHTVYVHAIVHDTRREEATTFLNYNNCTNHGAQLVLSTPGGACSSEATGKTSGHAGLIVSAGLEAALDPPLSAEEIRGVLIMSADDIDVPESVDPTREGLTCTRANAEEVCGTDGNYACVIPLIGAGSPPTGTCSPTKYPSGPGWDFHFGYGRNNATTSVDMVLSGQIPPEVDIVTPQWFETIDPTQTPSLAIVGRIGDRLDERSPRYGAYAYRVEYALGPDPKGDWTVITEDTTSGLSGTLATLDLTTLPSGFDLTNPPEDPHEDMLTVRVKVTAEGPSGPVESEFRKAFFVHHDASLVAGFPIDLGASGEASIRLVDFDDDGRDEIVSVSSEGIVRVLRHDGTMLDGFPVTLGWRPGHAPDTPGNYARSCAYRDDKAGCVAQQGGAPFAVHQSTLATPGIGDLDADGDLELVVSTWDGYVFAWHHDGTMLDGFPVRSDRDLSADARTDDRELGPRSDLDEGFFGAPVLYDMDGDGDLEIIQSGQDQHVYVWHHDGAMMDGWPVLCRDTEMPGGGLGFRIVTTPAVGDLDGDGEPELVLGTNEYYDGPQGRMYLLRARGNADPDGPFELGGPQRAQTLIGEVLPLVGQGLSTNAAIADIDGDGRLEFALEALGQTPKFWRLESDGLVQVAQVDSTTFGAESNSLDAPALPLINHGAFGELVPGEGAAYVKGTAGLGFRAVFDEGGKRSPFDHHISAWSANPAKANGAGQLPFIEGFPQVMEDWQFFMNPALVDLTGDGGAEVLVGSGGYLLHAFDYQGNEAPGFPKSTGGWIIASPAVGDIDGDGTFEVVTQTRNGWLFAWHTGASSAGRIDWQGFGHDPRNTNNATTPLLRDYVPPARCGDGVINTDDEGCDGADLGGQTCAVLDDEDIAWSGLLGCTDACTLDFSGCEGTTTASPDAGGGSDTGADAGDVDAGIPPEGLKPTDTCQTDCCCTVPAQPKPTPLPVALGALGLVALAWRRRRR